jgi:hypothetical protein
MFDPAIRRARRLVQDTFAALREQAPPRELQEATLPHLDRALAELAHWMELSLRRDAPGGWLAVWASSNFIERAALDLLGPSMCAAILESRGEWAAPSTVSSLARGLASLFSTQPETRRERVVKLIQYVIDSHIGFALSMTGRILHDANLLGQAFDVSNSIQSIYIAGSDPHKCAHRVAIVTPSRGNKFVYKPSDLTFQMMLMGDRDSHRLARPQLPALGTQLDSLFSLLAVGLPLLRIVPGARKDDGHYGYMEFKQRVTRLPHTELPEFFHKFGRLAGVASMFGLTDLHQENCLATATGPYLIDAEMGFSYPRTGVNKVTRTAISRALTPPTGARDSSIAGGVFIAWHNTRTGAITADSLNVRREEDDDNSYVSSSMGGGLIPGRNYLDNLQAGLAEAVDAVGEHADAIRAWLRVFDTVRPVARVPLSTSLMASFYLNGIERYLAGTLPPGNNLPGLSFPNWFIRYAGVSNSTPAAYIWPHSAVSLHDPAGAQGLSVASCGSDIEVSSTLEIRVHVTAMKNRMALAQEKHTLSRMLREAVA